MCCGNVERMAAADWIALGNIVLTALLAVGGIVVLLLRRNADGTSSRVEKHGDKQASQGETLAALRADINQLKSAGEKCDELDRDVAVLKDFKARAETKFDEVDDVTRAQERFGEQMRTVFKRLDGIDEKIDRIPQETAEKLRTMIRPVPAQGRV